MRAASDATRMGYAKTMPQALQSPIPPFLHPNHRPIAELPDNLTTSTPPPNDTLFHIPHAARRRASLRRRSCRNASTAASSGRNC